MYYSGMYTQVSTIKVRDLEKYDVAYDGLYTYDLCRKMAWLFEYADVSELDVQQVFTDMLKTDYREFIETCHPHYVGGCSASEFAQYILIDRLHLNVKNTDQAAPVTSAYWAGWYITMFQWLYNISWDDIEKYCKVDMVRNEIFPAGHTASDAHIFDAFITKLKLLGYDREFEDPWDKIDRLSEIKEESLNKEFEVEEIEG